MKGFLLKIFYRYIMLPFLKLIVGISFKGRERFKGLEQFIIVANHNSHIDTAAILASIPAEMVGKTHPVAAADHFKGLGRFLSSLLFNAVFIRRGSIKSIKDMQEILDRGESIIIFPEGTRGTPEVMSKFKKGVAVLLRSNPTVPCVPIYLSGLGKVMPKDDGLVVPFSSKLVIGTPSTFSDRDPEEITENIYNQLIGLKEQSDM